MLKTIEKSIVRKTEETTDTRKQAAVNCCVPKADLTHKIQEEVDRKKNLFISNLMALP